MKTVLLAVLILSVLLSANGVGLKSMRAICEAGDAVITKVPYSDLLELTGNKYTLKYTEKTNGETKDDLEITYTPEEPAKIEIVVMKCNIPTIGVQSKKLETECDNPTTIKVGDTDRNIDCEASVAEIEKIICPNKLKLEISIKSDKTQISFNSECYTGNIKYVTCTTGTSEIDKVPTISTEFTLGYIVSLSYIIENNNQLVISYKDSDSSAVKESLVADCTHSYTSPVLTYTCPENKVYNNKGEVVVCNSANIFKDECGQSITFTVTKTDEEYYFELLNICFKATNKEEACNTMSTDVIKTKIQMIATISSGYLFQLSRVSDTNTALLMTYAQNDPEITENLEASTCTDNNEGDKTKVDYVCSGVQITDKDSNPISKDTTKIFKEQFDSLTISITIKGEIANIQYYNYCFIGGYQYVCTKGSDEFDDVNYYKDLVSGEYSLTYNQINNCKFEAIYKKGTDDEEILTADCPDNIRDIITEKVTTKTIKYKFIKVTHKDGDITDCGASSFDTLCGPATKGVSNTPYLPTVDITYTKKDKSFYFEFNHQCFEVKSNDDKDPDSTNMISIIIAIISILSLIFI